MLKTQVTAQQLYEKLKNIKLGASVCQYSLRKCEELVPIINEINELKEENLIYQVNEGKQRSKRYLPKK